MPVYVDRLMTCKPNSEWRWKKVSHLTADSIEELHAFAQRLGLKRVWFQAHSRPHYDLTTSKKRQALSKGAIEK